MIEAKGLTKTFDTFTAVDDLTFNVGPGELLALLGPNGAGKTTTVRMLSAILSPTKGSARINGYDVVEEADQVRRMIGLLTEQPGLYSRSSGLEYLLFFGRLYGMSDEEIRHRGLELFNRFAMPQTAHRRLGEYSKGMRQKVGIIRAMLHSPAVLLLDEPTSAMDPHSAKLVRDAINELRADNRAIVVCTHNLLEAELLADKIAIIDKGRIVAEDNPVSLKRKMHALHKYEVHVDQKLNGQIKEIEDLVDVDSIDGDVIHFSTEDPFKNNPRLVRRLTGLGIGIVSIRELSVSLEDVYLTIVSDESDGDA